MLNFDLLHDTDDISGCSIVVVRTAGGREVRVRFPAPRHCEKIKTGGTGFLI